MEVTRTQMKHKVCSFLCEIQERTLGMEVNNSSKAGRDWESGPWK